METALCAHCQAAFPQKTSRRKFCSDRCRKAAWTANRQQELALVEDSLTRTLARVRRLRLAKAIKRTVGRVME